MKLHNPILMDNAKSRDPVIVPWNGHLYSCYDGKDSVVVRKFSSLDTIGEAEEKKVYVGNEGDPMNWYAPEMHLIDGHWYIYGAPNYPGSTVHCMQVLRSATEDPMSEYEYLGAVRGLENEWSIDATVFTHGGRRYMVLAMNGLVIAEMSDPLTLKEAPRPLAGFDYPWEQVMNPVVEGPAVLEKNGTLHIVYSASDSKCDDYCLGLMTFQGGDILDKTCWKKRPTPVFRKANGLYGPGHCSFARIGEQDILVYHANTVSGSGWTGSYLCAQPFGWDGDEPVFGEPLREFEIE